MQVVNERDTVYVTAVRRNSADTLSAPTTLDWRLSLTDGTTLQDWTAVANPASEQEVTVPSAKNAMQDSGAPYEDRVLTFRFNYGYSNVGYEQTVYRIRNMAGVT